MSNLGPKRVLSLLVLVIAASPLSADWLVTRDGGRVETKGKWGVEGGRVVFTLPNGTMGVLRKSEVDLDASAAATAEAQSAPTRIEKKAEEPKSSKPILTLTDKDIPKARPIGPNENLPAEIEAARNQDPKKQDLVVVTSWSQAPAEGGGLQIAGEVKNVGIDIAVNITVEIEVQGSDGQLQKASGYLDKSSLVRESTAVFRAIFPDVEQFTGTPRFKVDAEGASIGVEKPKDKPSP